MNIIRMSGGIGNQMFQYALYLKLISMGKEVKFDDVTEYKLDNARPIMLSVFGIDYPKASSRSDSDYGCFHGITQSSAPENVRTGKWGIS